MAVEPVTLAMIVAKAVNVVADEEKRKTLILGISIAVTVVMLVIFIPIYLLTHPLDTIKMIVTGELDLSLIEKLQEDYSVAEYGELNYIGKFPFPLKSSEHYTVTSRYGARIHPITRKAIISYRNRYSNSTSRFCHEYRKRYCNVGRCSEWIWKLY